MMTSRKTKIVATIGPACRSPEMLRPLIEAGVDVARLNFSHADHAEHGENIQRIRAIALDLDRPIAILQDLQGPKIRTGTLRDGRAVELRSGRRLTVTAREVAGDEHIVSTTYQPLPREVRPGATILVDDGLIELRVEAVRGDDIVCEIVRGGLLKEHKGMNLPGVPISAPAITAKDRHDLQFGISQEVDYVAISFVRHADDVIEAKALIREGGADIPVIAKIERPEALANLAAIIEAADGVMVARGDLGVETSSADVPLLQKQIILESNRLGKIDITATQMLGSMTDSPTPSRAEACDVANAIFDGTDAVMLSNETAAGRFPLQAVRTMARIALKAETGLAQYSRLPGDHLLFRGKRCLSPYPDSLLPREDQPVPAQTGLAVTQASVHAACLAAADLNARAIVVFTRSGRTAVCVSQCRPLAPIVAFTPDPKAYRRLALAWGVRPYLTHEVADADDLIRHQEDRLRRLAIARPGDVVVMLAGTTDMPGASNIMKIHQVGAG